jgi:hypothetical protein
MVELLKWIPLGRVPWQGEIVLKKKGAVGRGRFFPKDILFRDRKLGRQEESTERKEG